MTKQLQQVKNKLLQNNIHHIAITFHNSPDGDAIGSAVALALALNKLNKNVDIITSYISPVFSGITSQVNIVKHKRRQYDCTVLLDCSDIYRTIADIDYLSNYLIVIDHHAGYKPLGNIYVFDDVPATAMIIYELIKSLTDISNDMATALYAGLYGDTSGFSNSNVTADAHKISCELIESGADLNEIRQIYCYKHLNALKLASHAFSHLIFDKQYKILYVILMQEEIASTNATYDEASGLIDCLKNVYEADIIFLFLESTNDTKVRARSNNECYNVADIMRTYDGGGHWAAAGASIDSVDIYGIAESVISRTKEYIDNKKK